MPKPQPNDGLVLYERGFGQLSRMIHPRVEVVEPIWKPLPGPQERVTASLADVTGMGGAAGGGKTDEALGLAFTKHRNSIIFRSHFTDLTSMVERGNEIQDGRCTFVWGTKRRWETPDGRLIELGAVEHEKDKFKYRGRPHDLIVIDEAAEFKESIFRFLIGWLRTTDTSQRTRVVLTFNPPQTPEGQWIVDYFAPWLDPQYANPAEPGELRWFARIDDKDVEVAEDWRGVDRITGEPILPKSRTFIPARVEDNPFLMATGYARELDNLPEPLRSQLRYGLFTASFEDHPWQTIPTAWILAANERWKTQDRPDLALRALGVDASRGGNDQSVIASMFGNWVAPLATFPGKDIPDGPALAKKVEDHLMGDAVAFIDMIGIGTSPYDILRQRKARVYGVHFGKASTAKDKTGKMEFASLRAECYWRAREMLDPNSDWEIALPPDRELLVDLCAPRYSAEGRKIKIELKELIKDRIGRSPDKGDAVVMLLWGVLMGAGRKMNMV